MTEQPAWPRYAPADLRGFAATLFERVGLDADKAAIVAEILVEADLMGHTTHGLALAPRYLQEIESGAMRANGTPEVISDRGACVSWDGKRLPGVWLTASAVDLAVERAGQYGTVTVAIGNSHHIGCLAAFLPRATARGMLAIVSCSDPSQANVAPYGGRQALFSPNPIAVGIPTASDPILIDTSASVTTNNMSARLVREGRRYPRPWVLDSAGNPSDDPAVLKQGGSILPAGGLDHGQKGYAWALMVEALTQGLAGFGRSDAPKGWGACVYVEVIDPTAFSGREAFTRQTSWLAEACRANPPRAGVERVRLPGEQALAHRAASLADGTTLYPGVFDSLQNWAGKFGIQPPEPLQDTAIG